MKILRAGDYKRMPWKNGGGETVEIAVFPHDASVDTFDWRISMAAVAQDGPFSVFPGVDRTLSVLEGNGIDLTVDGREATRLTQASAPLAFPADAPTMARLLDGPIRDLNVMSRRAAFSHVVEHRSAPMLDSHSTHCRLVFCKRGDLLVSSGDHRDTLGPQDALLCDMGEMISVTGEGALIVITLASAGAYLV
ncbi:MAG: HutD family protein [Pseudorhizobium sp.]